MNGQFFLEYFLLSIRPSFVVFIILPNYSSLSSWTLVSMLEINLLIVNS